MGESLTFRRSWVYIVAALIVSGSAHQAEAQGFISPFLGYNFSGDAGCPQITDCEDKHANYGVAFGALGGLVGFEAEVARTNDFLGASSNQTTNVLTFMGNFMLAPKIGPVQPYGLAGLGLIRTSVEGVGASSDQNQFGWDVGGGLMVFFGGHVGIRGDVRYFHAFQVLDFLNLQSLPIPGLGGKKLDYGRAAAAVVFKF